MAEPSMHLKLQEYCDCYMETDYWQELDRISRGGTASDSTGDPKEVALKFLALTVLNSIDKGAESIKLVQKENGRVKFKLSADRDYRLPPPPYDLCEHIFSAMRAIAHLDEATTSRKLALGLRNDSIELSVTVESEKDRTSLKIRFPSLR